MHVDGSQRGRTFGDRRVRFGEAARLGFFEHEGRDYAARELSVRDEAGGARRVWAFVPTAALRRGPGRWDLAEWQRFAKRDFLVRAQRSMRMLEPKDLEPYLPVDPGVLAEKKIEVHYLGYYVKWVPQECYYFAVEHAGFEANTERTEGTYSKYNSIDDRMDGLHYYTTYIKFGLGRASYDAAQEIRNTHLTREEGVALVRRFDGEFPKKWFQENIDYIGITEGRFWEIVDQFRSPHLWKREGDRWALRHQVS